MALKRFSPDFEETTMYRAQISRVRSRRRKEKVELEEEEEEVF